ncbi:hypothetical protein AJ79_05379 [Helicocarpus griseus UAMH5409]|uniref:Uncharacterized protein n=1 Tax=Helicocarpus griseus UAMH5409 TaxID=1447875 RepID=A0A2B7XNZ8_9EURO|nr:hypothetical protein AJ79_05379 [Helicocarpus griseus UAMH5409]
MEVSVSSLSKLSPSQVEKASFTPRKLSQPAAQANMPLSEPHPSNTLQFLQNRLAEQDARISSLEKLLQKHQIKTAEEEDDGKQTVTSAYVTAAPSPVFKTLQPENVKRNSTGSDDGALRYQILHLKLCAIMQQRNSNYAPEPSPPLSSPPAQSPSLLDDFGQLETSVPTLVPSKADYLSEDLAEFESRLQSKVANPKTEHNDVTWEKTNETLIEGIDAPEEISYVRKEPKFAMSSIEPVVHKAINRPTPLPWDGTIKYTLATSSPFDDTAQEMGALNAQPPNLSTSLGLFQHGLVFKPHKTDENVYRTVAVTNLPLGSCLRHLFQAIRGGPIYSAHLMNMERTAGYHMGIVTFIHEKDARAYVDFAKDHGVLFDDQRANVIMFKTATYPISVEMNRKIKSGHTRCISIKGPRDPDRYSAVAAFVEKELPVYFDLGDDMMENEDATELQMHFNSITAASAAMEAFRRFSRFADCQLSFAPDPCSRSFPACPCH